MLSSTFLMLITIFQTHFSSSPVVDLAGYCPSKSGFLSVHHWDVPDLFIVCSVCSGGYLCLEI
jgi:hypothetical protein